MYKIKAILSVTSKLGIGKENKLLVSIPRDLKNFKETTENQVVIMGRKTWDSIGRVLPNRINIILTSDYKRLRKRYTKNDQVIFIDKSKIKSVLKKIGEEKIYYIIGGADTLDYFIKNDDTTLRPSELKLTFIKNKLDADVYIKSLPEEYRLGKYSKEYNTTIEQEGESELRIDYRYLTYNLERYHKTNENVYLNILRKVLGNGIEKSDRTGTGVLSTFGEQMRFDISESFPLLTSKYVPFKSVVEELLWFVRGDTDAKSLEKVGVNIWKGNTSREFLDNRNLNDYSEGVLGPGYGWSMRHYGEPYIQEQCDVNGKKMAADKDVKNTVGKDQLGYIVDLLKNDPDSRRIYMNYWNPVELEKIALVPCHVSFQLYTKLGKDNKRYLSGHLYQRSMDLFLGAPWNIASYSLLLYILAKKCDMLPDELIISTGDTHIYKNHIEQVKVQLERNNLPLPRVFINDTVYSKEWEELNADDFELIGYFNNGIIKGKMAV
jgi:thymidylate synthase